MTLFDKPEIQFRKKRHLSARTDEDIRIDKKQTPQSIKDIPTSELITGTLNKLTILEKAIEKATKEQTIPVDENHPFVKAAVKRRDPLSNGNYITRKLYIESLGKLLAYQRMSNEDIAGSIKLTATDELHSLRKAALNKQEQSNPNNLIGSQVLHLYTLQAMQAGFQSLQGLKSTLLPNAPEAFTELAASIAFLISYTTNSINDIKLLLKELTSDAGDVNVDNLIEQSKKLVTEKKGVFFKAALESKKDSDTRLIIEYVHNFLANTKDVGYEPWFFIYDMYEMRIDLENNKKSIETNTFLKGTDLEKLFRKRASTYNKILNKIATALAKQESSASLACSLEFLLNIPEEFLFTLKSIYEIGVSLKTTDLSIFIPEISIKGLIWQILEDAITYLYTIGRNVLCWFKNDPELWNILYECPAIAELVDAAISVLEELEQKILDVFEDVIDELRKKERFLTFKSQIVYESFRMKILVSKYNTALSSIKSSIRTAATLKKTIENLPKTASLIGKRIDIHLKKKASSLEDFVESEFENSFVISGTEETPFPSLPIPKIC